MSRGITQLLRDSDTKHEGRGRRANKRRRLLKKALAKRDGGFDLWDERGTHRWFAPCRWCRVVFPLPSLTIDHVIRQADGGAALGSTNLVLACPTCNSGRHHKPLSDITAPPEEGS